MNPSSRRVCTLVLTDLVDSTGLIETLGDARAAEVFRRVDRVARDLFTERHGQEIDRTDGHLVLFDLPLAGVEYAVTLHERLAALRSELGVPLSCRAAVHVGEVVLRANTPEDVARGAKPVDVEGLTKPATARLLSLALPNQTLLGRTAHELARRATVGQPAFDKYVWVSHGDYRFQGLDEPFPVHEVGLAGRAPLRAPPDSSKARRSIAPASAPAKRRTSPWLVFVSVAVSVAVAGVYLTRSPTPSAPPTPLAEFVVNPPGTWASAPAACMGSPLAISHDGMTVAFAAADKDGHELGLVIRPLDALEARPTRLGHRPLGAPDTRPNSGGKVGTYGDNTWISRDPFFSPDDRWLGFFQGDQLGRVLLAGGAPERVDDPAGEVVLTGSAKGATWTPAGIVASPGISSGLIRFPLDDGPPVVISTPDPQRGETSHRWPDLLPDGNHLLISIKSQSLVTFDDADIAVVGIDGGAPEVVFSGGYYPRYSPSGHIVFARQGSLLAVPFDATRRVVTGPAVQVLRDVMSSPGNGTTAFAMARNGTLVYVPGGSCEVETQLVWTSPDGTQESIDVAAGFYSGPVLSPDGTRVAVRRLGVYDAQYVWSLERKTLTRVTFGVNAGDAVWDVDGDHLFVQIADGNGSAVARIRADGTGDPQILHRVPSDQNFFLYELVSVGGHPALVGSLDEKGIVLFSLEGDPKVTPVVEGHFSEFAAAVSPDGRCLATVSMESGRREVYLQPFPTGSGRTQVSNAGGARPMWSRDGNWLLYGPPEAAGDPSRRVAVATRPGDCLTIAKGTTTPMPAPPGERVLEIRDVAKPVRDLNVVAIQGWADTLKSAAP